MSSYRALTKHPFTGKYIWAQWDDDYFGHNNYGVLFDGESGHRDPRLHGLETIESSNPDWYEDPCPWNTTAALGQAEDGSAESPEDSERDFVNNPPHYNDHPSGIECIEVTRHFNFAIGNAIKYLWRHGKKDPEKTIEDLKKAIFYIEDEINRLTNN